MSVNYIEYFKSKLPYDFASIMSTFPKFKNLITDKKYFVSLIQVINKNLSIDNCLLNQ